MAGWADYDTVISVLRDATGSAAPYLLGEQFTAADVVIGSSLRWGMQFKLLPDLPEFVAYVERAQGRAQRCSGRSPRTRHLHVRRPAEESAYSP